MTPYDFLSELTKDWEAAAKIPSTVSTRSVVIRTGEAKRVKEEMFHLIILQSTVKEV